MTQRIDIRAPLLIALAAAFATPAFAQNADAAQVQDTQAQDQTQATQAQAAQDQSAAPQQATAAATPKSTRWSDLDANQDGSLSKTEADTVPSLGAVFDKADANADGALTGDEYKAYVAMNGRATNGHGASSKPGKH